MNIAQNVERAARLFPDKTAILFEGTHLTYKELNARVNRIASALLTEGIARGDRVALYLPNIPAFVISYLATVRIGEQGISLTISPEALNIYWNQRLQHCRTTGPLEYHLPHMRDVKQARSLAGVQMLLDNAAGVLHWHVVTGKRNHFGTQFAVQCIQWCSR